MKQQPNILTVEEILDRLPHAGIKRQKQLLAKLIRRRGGKPILHLRNPGECESSSSYGEGWEEHWEEAYGFSHMDSSYAGEEYSSVSGNFSNQEICKILKALCW